MEIDEDERLISNKYNLSIKSETFSWGDEESGDIQLASWLIWMMK